jgi:hypothetical protein
MLNFPHQTRLTFWGTVNSRLFRIGNCQTGSELLQLMATGR